MVCCAIYGCNHHYRHSKKFYLKFHRFPKDINIRSKWINICKRSDPFSADIARVCSSHFDRNDYMHDLKSELLNLPPKRILKSDAIPHINLPSFNSVLNPSHVNDQRRRLEKRNFRKETEELLQISENGAVQNSKDNSINENIDEVKKCKNCEETEKIYLSFDSLKKENESLKCQVKDLKERLDNVSNELIRVKKLYELIKGSFSECQQKVVTSGRCANWSCEDIAKAITFRCISYKALSYVRDVMKFPLPSETTIKRRLKQFSVPPGFISLSCAILGAQATLFTEYEKDVIL